MCGFLRLHSVSLLPFFSSRLRLGCPCIADRLWFASAWHQRVWNGHLVSNRRGCAHLEFGGGFNLVTHIFESPPRKTECRCDNEGVFGAQKRTGDKAKHNYRKTQISLDSEPRIFWSEVWFCNWEEFRMSFNQQFSYSHTQTHHKKHQKTA